MEKLTRKQATEYIRDPANWTTIPGNTYVRASKLNWPIPGQDIIGIETPRVANYIKVLTEDEDPDIKFFRNQYLEFTDKSIGSVSETYLANKLYDFCRTGNE